MPALLIIQISFSAFSFCQDAFVPFFESIFALFSTFPDSPDSQYYFFPLRSFGPLFTLNCLLDFLTWRLYCSTWLPRTLDGTALHWLFLHIHIWNPSPIDIWSVPLRICIWNWYLYISIHEYIFVCEVLDINVIFSDGRNNQQNRWNRNQRYRHPTASATEAGDTCETSGEKKRVFETISES